MSVNTKRLLWADILEKVGNFGNSLWDDVGKILNISPNKTPQLPSSKNNSRILSQKTNSVQPAYWESRQKQSWLDNQMHNSNTMNWRQFLGGLGKVFTIIGGSAAIIFGIIKLATKRRNLFPHFITDFSRLSNTQIRVLQNMNLGGNRISQIRRITISGELKDNARDDLNRNIRRNLQHARLSTEQREDYELCFIAQYFDGHSIRVPKTTISINPIRTCVISQDHHIHNVIPHYLNYEHCRIDEKIPKNRVLLIDANILINYEHRSDSEELRAEAQHIEAMFDNAEKNNNHIWITDRIAKELIG